MRRIYRLGLKCYERLELQRDRDEPGLHADPGATAFRYIDHHDISLDRVGSSRDDFDSKENIVHRQAALRGRAECEGIVIHKLISFIFACALVGAVWHIIIPGIKYIIRTVL